MIKKYNLEKLPKDCCFSRGELLKLFEDNGFDMSIASFNNQLLALLNSGDIVRVGHNSYVLGNSGCSVYSHTYSDAAESAAEYISCKYPFIDFRIFETRQLNEFVNHLLAHNTIIVYVEQDALEMVFEEMRIMFPGKVLINPSIDMYHQYWCDDMIVLKKLVSESPKGLRSLWHTRLEKLIVDITTDKLLREIIEDDEIDIFIEDAVNKYMIDKSCLSRYAKRRKALARLEMHISTDNLKRMGLIHD